MGVVRFLDELALDLYRLQPAGRAAGRRAAFMRLTIADLTSSLNENGLGHVPPLPTDSGG